VAQKFHRTSPKPPSFLGIILALTVLAIVGYFIFNANGRKLVINQANHIAKEDVEVWIKEYIMANPKIIFDAMEKFYIEKSQQDKENSKKNISAKLKELEDDAADPRAGSGKIKVVEFYDYNCGYCKHMAAVKIKLLESNKNVQLIFKETPVLSSNSLLAAKAALAVNKIDKSKYFAFQNELLQHHGEINEQAIEQAVNKLGLDWTHVKKEMAEKSIEEHIEKNKKLAYEIGIQGTPAYVVAGELIPGRVSLEELQKIVNSKK
jgi:protein-disulfide isomerase